MNWLRQHLERHEQRPPGNYIWRVGLESFLVAVVILIIGEVIGIPDRNIKHSEIPGLLLTAVAVAPLIETFLLQFLPIRIARACGATRRMQVIVSMVLFAVPHFIASPLTGLTAGLIGGFYFAFTFTHWHRRSLGWAFWMTFAHHTLYNAALAAIVLVALLFE